MTYKTRNHIWPVSLVMAIAFIGAVAAIVALAALPGTTSAQAPPPPPAPPGATETPPDDGGLPTPPPLPEDPNRAPVVSGTPAPVLLMGMGATSPPMDVAKYFSDADGDELSYALGSTKRSVATAHFIHGTMVTITAVDGGSADITVTATDPQGASAELLIPVTVTLLPAERYGLTPNYPPEVPVPARVGYKYKFTVSAKDADASPLDEDATVTVQVNEHDGDDDVDMIVGQDGLDSAPQPWVAHLQGLLTVRAVDPEGTRSFELDVDCRKVGDRVTIDIFDDDRNPVGDAFIICGPPAVDPPEPPEPPEPPVPDTIIPPDCYQVTGNPDEMLDDMRNAFGLRVTVDGHDTVELLVGEPSVQLTVTSCEEGPVWIRFMDSDMMPFGADVDEEAAERGADVSGLNSQGRLDLNIAGELDESMALAYDHYEVVTPNDPPGPSYLRGKAGMYYQGKFQFMDPCPAVGDFFYVEVRDKLGKEVQATETVSCVLPRGIGPTELSVTVHTDRPGEATLEWQPVEGADKHWVVVIDSATRTAVFVDTDANYTGTLVTGLVSGVEYHFAVIAERTDGGTTQYSANFITQTSTWADGS